MRSCPSFLTHGLSQSDKKKVRKCFGLAQKYLSGIQRRTGISYAEHGTRVALALREITNDTTLVVAALIHDIFLLPNGEELLGGIGCTREETKLAKSMHELRHLHIDANTRDLDRVIAAFSSDDRLLLLRMAHRLNDVRHLDLFAPALQRAIARETLHMYTSIAGRLGMHAWRYEMEDMCFRFLQPRIAKNLERRMRACHPLDMVCIQHAKRFFRSKLRQHTIPCRMTERIKGLYSTYRKMVIKERRFEELTDRLALRLIVPTVEDCYRTLGIVHGAMHPIPGKLKDYIGAPKENGYRSIHTVVYPLPGVTEQPMEIQIRTEDMDKECEYGIPNHSDYKHFLYTLRTQPTRVQLFRNLESLRHEARSPKQFEVALRTYFDDDHLALFDAKNNLYHMKEPVTALDFICHAFGRRCASLRSIRINGRELPMETLLHDGDTVEPRFGRERTLKKHWASLCRSAFSEKLIRQLSARSP